MADLDKKQTNLVYKPEFTRSRGGIADFLENNRRPLSALLVFIILMLFFIIANPKMFLDWKIYDAVFRYL